MVTLFKCNRIEDAIARPNDCLLFTWANRSVHGLGRWISSRNRTHEFHLAKNRRERVKLVSKMGLKKWNTDFLLEYYDRENWTTLTFRTLRSFQEFFTDTTPQVVFLNFTYWFLGNIFVNGKQKAMSNSTEANFRLKAFETPFYFILLLGCLWRSSVLKWAWCFLLAQIGLWRVQRVRKI